MTSDESERLIRMEVRLQVIEAEVMRIEASCVTCKGSLMQQVDKVAERMRLVELRLAFYTTSAALLGSILGPALSNWFAGFK